jgi:hypothetical protein
VTEPAGAPPDDLPRRNGELAFDAPWESRAFGTTAAYLRACGLPWERFRAELIAAVRSAPVGTTYYESFAAALEALVVGDGALSRPEIDARASAVHTDSE